MFDEVEQIFIEQRTIKGTIGESQSMILECKSKAIDIALMLHDFSFTSFIITLFNDQNSSHRIKPQTLVLTTLDFFWKIDAILMMKLAVSMGVLIGILVPHKITTFFTDDSKGNQWLTMEHFQHDLLQCLSSMWSPPMPKFYLGLLWWSLLIEEY